MVVFGAFNAAGDIGPAIGHMLGAKDGDNRLIRFWGWSDTWWLARIFYLAW